MYVSLFTCDSKRTQVLKVRYGAARFNLRSAFMFVKESLTGLALAYLAIVVCLPLKAESATTVPVYGVFEVTLSAAGNYPNPYLQMPGDDTAPGFVEGTFTGPSGETLKMDGFWDGGTTWKV